MSELNAEMKLQIQIAELAGWTRIRERTFFHDEPPKLTGIMPDGDTLELVPEWPKDIRCAMELWDEMRGAASSSMGLYLKVYGKRVVVDLWLPGSKLITADGEDEKLAICDCWRKWKEGQGE